MPSVRVLEPSRPTLIVGADSVAMAATPTDVVTLRGAASKIIQVRRVFLSGLSTTAGQMLAALVKRTAANTGGTSTNPTPGQRDSGDTAAAAAVVTQYSANPSGLGTGVQVGTKRRLFFQLAGGGVPGTVEWRFGGQEVGGKSLRLNSASEWLAINFGGGAIPAGGVLDYEIEWTEQ